ncbi:MAG TPA: class I SAM-dependent methyltransferase [Anaerolineales bacterium]|jgi:ubiquinone/menaquinone biosynthesis C-methylase UbiE|nr:class I SAM-dependent methyltransferase [Anaerolineales bacterium]
MKMTNRWNRLIYRLWAPIYDSTVNLIFLPGRRRALELLNLQAGERVLIIGVGTGADLPLLPAGVMATGIDLSPEMLAKARLKIQVSRASIELIEGDAQNLLVEPASFDAVILNLILSVIPDANACLKSAFGALKPGGRAVIFDKFLQEGQSASPIRKFVNLFSTLLGTDINRRLSDMMRDCTWLVTCDEPGIAGGMYRVLLLKKPNDLASNVIPVSAK